MIFFWLSRSLWLSCFGFRASRCFFTQLDSCDLFLARSAAQVLVRVRIFSEHEWIDGRTIHHVCLPSSQCLQARKCHAFSTVLCLLGKLYDCLLCGRLSKWVWDVVWFACGIKVDGCWCLVPKGPLTNPHGGLSLTHHVELRATKNLSVYM